MKNRINHCQLTAAIVLTAAGCLVSTVAALRPVHLPKYQTMPLAATPATAAFATPDEATLAQIETMKETQTVEEETQAEEAPLSPDQLNLAAIFPENSETSYAQLLADALTSRESQWNSEIYSLYSSPTVTGIKARYLDGDGKVSQWRSNIKEILALTNVYYTAHPQMSLDELNQYALSLWEGSHSYTSSQSDVYYCEGCEDVASESTQSTAASLETSETVADEESSAENLATPAEAIVEGMDGGPGVSAASAEQSLISEENAETETLADVSSGAQENQTERFCPGHTDLEVSMQAAGLSEKNSLYVLDSLGNVSDENWRGWTQEMRDAVTSLLSQDWYESYGLTVESAVVRNPLTSAEISLYMKLLPESISESRRTLVRYALSSVGRIPYYWGGKPYAAGYERNHFGTVISPDVDGRRFRGLDCSGWISWLYWSALGQRLGAESTSNLAGIGTAITKADLQPGDICIRPGSNAHVVMFLGWTAEGQMLCIQETSGNINNVEVGIVTPDWGYYRKILD